MRIKYTKETISFQLTTSRRGRRIFLPRIPQSWRVSTHDLTKRSTPRTFLFRNLDSCFNSRPHEEVDMRFLSQLHIISVSTHDLTKRSTLTLLWREWFKMFQLTTSRRGRLWSGLRENARNRRFNSRPHEEVDLCLSCFTSSVGVSTHDLTKRSTLHSTCRNMALYLFQLTTSRRGRLIIIIIASVLTNVSTHDLTKRSTCKDCNAY